MRNKKKNKTRPSGKASTTRAIKTTAKNVPSLSAYEQIRRTAGEGDARGETAEKGEEEQEEEKGRRNEALIRFATLTR